METKCWDPPSFSSRQSLGFWWRKIWKLRLPPKVRIFMWKASRDFLPTEVNLLAHHIPIRGACSLCNFHYASTTHCLIFCLVVKEVWKNTPFWFCLKNHQDATFIECAIYIYISTIFSLEDFELFAIIC